MDVILEDSVVKAIFYFVFYGMLFFTIDKFMPDFFQTMVGWAESVYVYGEGLYHQALDALRQSSGK